jgi:alkanesulfonate monooxygenase SsuD/methylene tetrahydromethanopterin reductase-like flavin-dependent oxidoreductase (luciferase family)
MKVGIRLPQTGQQANLENVIHLAEAADKSGFDSLWALERLLWPIYPHSGENFPRLAESIGAPRITDFCGSHYQENKAWDFRN